MAVTLALTALRLPTVALPVTLRTPAVIRLPPDTFPVARISPAVPRLPRLALPVMLSVVDPVMEPVASMDLFKAHLSPART